MENLQGRLRQAIRLSRFPSIRKFAAAFSEKGAEVGLRGHSAPVLQRHLDGKGNPPDRQWLEVFADVAGVRLEWLVTNRGPRTDLEERVGFHTLATVVGADVAREAGDSISNDYLRAVLTRMVTARGETDGNAIVDLAKDLEKQLHAPAVHVTGEEVTDLFPTPEAYRAYALLVLQAMERALDAKDL
jgi:hypothetical protein